MSAADFFIREVIEHSRAMPVRDAKTFLAGALLLSNESEVIQPVRRAFNILNECDEQLELIAKGQFEIQPPAAPAKKGGK